MFQTETIVSGFGGALSLYLGVAIILLFELIELTCFLFVKGWRHVKGTYPKKRREEEKNNEMKKVENEMEGDVMSNAPPPATYNPPEM